jgi:hypothetical protein
MFQAAGKKTCPAFGHLSSRRFEVGRVWKENGNFTMVNFSVQSLDAVRDLHYENGEKMASTQHSILHYSCLKLGEI